MGLRFMGLGFRFSHFKDCRCRCVYVDVFSSL